MSEKEKKIGYTKDEEFDNWCKLHGVPDDRNKLAIAWFKQEFPEIIKLLTQYVNEEEETGFGLCTKRQIPQLKKFRMLFGGE